MPESMKHTANNSGGIGAERTQANPGPATLKTVRLSSSDPPLSVIFDLTGPVNFDQHLDNGSSSSTLTLYLKQVTPDSAIARHMVFDKSIFRDCDIDSDASGTKVVINTIPVTRYAVVPLDQPPRLLVTFTPQDTSVAAGPTAGSSVPPPDALAAPDPSAN
jgi:hypothetical protein